MQKPRGIVIAGNWKMNHTQEETQNFFSKLQCTSHPQVKCIAFPPTTSLQTAVAASRDLPVEMGAQNVHWEKTGAFTGEISGPMIRELGISHALVGHSERRQYFGETNETTRLRTESLLEQGFQVMLCIGETQEQYEKGQTSKVLIEQIQGAIPKADSGAAPYLDGRLLIAYEPVWAIGTGLTATPQQAEQAHQVIRKNLWDRFGIEASGKTPILYGGSVKPSNLAELLDGPNVDGALIGGASLKPHDFGEMLQIAAQKMSEDAAS